MKKPFSFCILIYAFLAPAAFGQFYEPEINFDALPRVCPPWPWYNAGETYECPALIEFHGYDLYLSAETINSRHEQFARLSPDHPDYQIDEDGNFTDDGWTAYYQNPDRALSKELYISVRIRAAICP